MRQMKLLRDYRRWPMHIWELFLWQVALWIEWSVQFMVRIQLVIPRGKIVLWTAKTKDTHNSQTVVIGCTESVFFFLIWGEGVAEKDKVPFTSEIAGDKFRDWLVMQFSSVQSLSHVWFSVTPCTAEHQTSLSIANQTSLWFIQSGIFLLCTLHIS